MKHIGEKVLGWFIVQDEDEDGEDESSQKKPRPDDDDAPPTTKSPSEPPVKGEATPARAKSKSPPTKPKPISVVVSQQSGSPSFEEIYRASGLPAADCERLGKVLELLASLPREASHEVKRSIVGAAMSAFNVPVNQIVASANGAVSAIDAYVTDSEHRTTSVVDQAEAKIAKLTSEIAEAHRLIEHQRTAQAELERESATEKSRVRAAVDFFSEQRAPRPQLVRLK